ncbi:MAG: efflux RND transporter periplasmic adaptor subunit [Rickettsiales bacterium]
MRNLFIILLVLILAAAWFISHWFRGVEITTIHPTRGSAVRAVYATGTVEPTVMMPISPRSSARLMELKVDEGDKVSKGQILAQLEDDEIQQSIKQLQAREEFAKTELKRNEMLIKSKSVPRKNYDQAKSDFEATAAATKAAQAQANYLQLIAPEDGLIIKRDGEVGQLITTNEPIFWLSCCAPLRISTEVDEEDISRVKIGQAVLIHADAFPKQVFHGKVQAITPKGDPIARSYRVRVEFTEDVPLLIGMTAETNIIISEKEDALLLPSSTIIQDKVWVISDGQLVQKDVSIGAKGVEKTEIISGISMDDFIVLKPDAAMEEGRKVRFVLIESEKP